MPDYKKLYYLLMNAAEDALAALEKDDPQAAARVLTEAELQAEEAVICEPELGR